MIANLGIVYACKSVECFDEVSEFPTPLCFRFGIRF